MHELKQTTNYSYGFLDYSCVELSVENIELLIKNKYKFSFTEVNDVLILYMDIDMLIKQCGLNNTVSKVINLIMLGYDYKFIAEKFGWYFKEENKYKPDFHKIQSILRTVCNKLYLQNQLNYTISLQEKGYIK